MSTTEVDRLARRSGFVFLGEVVQTSASTVELVEATKETAVVRVERVLRAPDDLGAGKGSEVTVRLASAAKKGQRAVFFTIGWVSGEGLAVQEIGRQAPGDPEAIEKRMGDVVGKDEIAELRRRVKEAHAVALGEVAETRALGDKEVPPSSEHDPQWRTAVIVVHSGEKGDIKEGQRVEVAYPSSDDVMWFRAPKPQKGDRAVFLMHQRGLEERDVQMLAIVDPVDMQPVERLDEIRRAV
jgi:hypothetical protein